MFINKKVIRSIKYILMKLNFLKIINDIRRRESYYDNYDEDLGKRFYADFITSGDMVFDIGANVGNRVNTFCKLGCKVIAVEPQSKCCNILHKRFANFEVIVENIGLSNEVGELEYYEADESVLTTFSKSYIQKVKNSRHGTTVWKKSKKVMVSTIENLVLKYGMPKFCKIDVEGYECQVLEGMKQNLPYISFEYQVPELNSELIKCVLLLMQKGNYVFNYSQGESLKLALSSWSNGEAFINIISSSMFIESNWGDIYCKHINY